MASLLKACFSSQGKKCLAQVKNVKLSVHNTKSTYDKTQTFIPLLHSRYFSVKSDQSPEKKDLTLIYSGHLSRHIRNLKAFSLITSGSALIGWPLLYLQSATEATPVGATSPMLVFTVIAIYAIGTPLLLHWITKKYVKHIYYDPQEDKYIATVYTIFCTEKKIEFKADDVIKPDIPGMFTIVEIKGTPLFFDVYTFDEPDHCRRIMGYDKPIDFKLNEDDIESIENVNSKKSDSK